MTVLRTVLAALVAATGLVLAAPTPAVACSCVMADAPQFVKWADVVVVGEITEITPPPEREVMSSVDPATYTVVVEEVMKGRSPATVDVRSAMSGASCGLEGIEVGREYVVFAAYNDIMGKRTDVLHASLCGGTALASDSYVAEVKAAAGPGQPPEPDRSSEPAGGPASEPAVETTDEPAASSAGVSGWVWAGGAVVVVVIGGLLVARRRQSGA